MKPLDTPLQINSPMDYPIEEFSEADKAAKVGASITPYLIKGLEGDDNDLAVKSAYALGMLVPPQGPDVAAALQKALGNANPKVEEEAIFALGRQEPVAPETIALLEEKAKQPPVERKAFSTGSRGMGGGVMAIPQQPIAFLAAEALAKIAPDQAYALFAQQIASTDANQQKTAIAGLSALIRLSLQNNSAHVLAIGAPLRSHMPADSKTLPPLAQKALGLLESSQKTIAEQNQKALSQALVQFDPKGLDAKTISALAKDLTNTRRECSESFGQNHCGYPEMANALYQLRAAGHSAALPEVYAGLESVLDRGGRNEINLVLDIVASCASDPAFPPELSQRVLDLSLNENDEGGSLFNAWAAIGTYQPAFSERAVTRLKKAVTDNSYKFARADAANALAAMAQAKPEQSEAIAVFLIDAYQHEADPEAKGFMLKGLAVMGPATAKAIPLLEAELDPASCLKTLAQHNPTASDNIADACYNLPFNAAQAFYAMKIETPQIAQAMEDDYRADLGRGQKCQFTSSRRNYLVNLIQAHQVNYPSRTQLVPPMAKLLESDNEECRRFVVGTLQFMGSSADALLPAAEKTLTPTATRSNGDFFAALDRIGTPKAKAMAEKDAALNPNTPQAQKSDPVDLLDAIQKYYSLSDLTATNLHIILVDHSPAKDADGVEKITVTVDRPGENILLALAGKDTLRWSVDVRPGSHVASVWLAGQQIQLPGRIPASVPYGGYTDTRRGFQTLSFDQDGQQARGPLEAATGHRAQTLEYFPVADHVSLDANTEQSIAGKERERQQKADAFRHPPVPAIAFRASQATGRALATPPPGQKRSVSVPENDKETVASMHKTKLKSKDLLRYGWWDLGDCHGDDQWMCGGSLGDIGCEQPAPVCPNGKAKAIDSYPGDRQCVLTWWRWECE